MIETTPEVLPPIENGRVAAFNATEAGLATLRAELEGKTFDCSDRAQDAEARSARRELVTLRSTIEQRRKELKAPLLERGRVLDDEAKRITGEVLKLETPIDDQIKAEEKRKADEKAERDRAARDWPGARWRASRRQAGAGVSGQWSEEYGQMLEDCEKRESKLSDWERTFVDSLGQQIARGRTPTPKQTATLDAIWERVTA